jgi:hypothetical protein
VTIRRSLVLADGYISELPSGDALNAGNVPTQVVAGSGLSGGGSVSTSPRLDVSLASNPSGIIFVGDALGIDGAAQVSANAGLASGNAAVFAANSALASGNNSLSVATAALASGNAALTVVSNLNPDTRNKITLTAAGPIVSGYAVGVDDTGRVQSINRLSGDNFNPPVPNSNNTVIAGISFAPYIGPTSLQTSDVENTFCFLYAAAPLLYPTLCGGTFLNSTPSLSSPLILESASSPSTNFAYAGTFLSTENKYVFTYARNTVPHARTIVVVVSGTTLHTGSLADFTGAPYLAVNVAASKTKNQVVNFLASSTSGIAHLGTISGLTYVPQSSALFTSGVGNIRANSFVYQSQSDSYLSIGAEGSVVPIPYVARLLTVSGTTINTNPAGGLRLESFSVFSFGLIPSAGYDPIQDRTVFSLPDGINNSTKNYVIVTSGNTLLTGPSGVERRTQSTSMAYDSLSQRFVRGYTTNSNGTPTIVNSAVISGFSLLTSSSGVLATSSSYDWGVSVAYNKPANRNLVLVTYNQFSGQLNILNPFQTYGYTPRVGSFPNVLGVAQSTVASGSPCVVALPGSTYTQPSGNFQTGAFYYADPTTSGLTTSSTPAALWSGQTPWNYIGRAISASGISVLKTL